MFGDVGVPELLIILVVVTLLFGVGKVGRLGKDLGTAVKEFRTAIRDGDEAPASGGSPASPAVESMNTSKPGQPGAAPGQLPHIF